MGEIFTQRKSDSWIFFKPCSILFMILKKEKQHQMTKKYKDKGINHNESNDYSQKENNSGKANIAL